MRLKQLILFVFASLLPLCAPAQKKAAPKATPVAKEVQLFNSAQQLLKQYQFDQANQELTGLLEEYPDCPLAAKAQQALRQATIGDQLLKHVKRVEVLDTLVVSQDEMLQGIRWGNDMGILTIDGDEMTYENARHTRRILSREGKLYLQDRGLDEWGTAEPIAEPVAQEGVRQVNPILMADGTTLIYAQDGPESLGELDLFQTKWNPQTRAWSQPENLGMPFNSLGNDFLLVIDEANEEAYFATNRNCPAGQVCIYHLLWKDPLPDEDEQDPAAYAMLRKTHPARKATGTPQEQKEKAAAATYAFDLLITEGVHYHQDSDFQKPEALEAFKVYQTMEANYQDQQRQLDSKRQQYGTAEGDAKALLQQEIPQLEQALRAQKSLLTKQLQEIRQLETAE